jgi:pimeloyl-ACP methyl ester carboxylesterase
MNVRTTLLGGLMLGVAHCAPAGAADPKQVNVNGTALTYVEEGQGVPVVLVHGAFGDYRTWSGEMDDFASHYHVVAYSMRYHYPSSWSGGQYSYQIHIADLIALLQALNLGPVHLVGHSYGGVMAAVVAKEHPELVRTLVLAEASINSLIINNETAKPLLGEVGKVATTAQEYVANGDPDKAAITFMDFVNASGGGFNGLPVAAEHLDAEGAFSRPSATAVHLRRCQGYRGTNAFGRRRVDAGFPSPRHGRTSTLSDACKSRENLRCRTSP